MSHLHIVHPTGLLYRVKFNTHMWLNSISMVVCHHICYFGFVNENKDLFLLDDHIWKCQNLNGFISKTNWDILFKFPGFFRLVMYLQMT